MSMDASFRSFIKAFTERWFIAVSGGLGVPLTALAVFWPSAPLQAVAAITGTAGLIFAAYRVWRKEREAVIALSPPRIRVREIVGHSSADILDTDEFIVADGVGNSSIRLDLPKSPKVGSRLEIKKGPNPNTATAVILNGNGQAIDGQPNYSLVFRDQAVTLTFVSTAAGWKIS